VQADLLSYSFGMLDYNISPYESMLTIRLHNSVSEADILLLSPKVDEYLEHHKRLAGVMLISKDWAGWDSFAALRATMTFLRGHHHKISRIALVTNSVLADLIPIFAGRFVNTTIRHFRYEDEANAKIWLTG
jgi:hypothetical protein